MAVTKKKKEKSHQRSQLGNQTESGKRSAPSVGFGTASRFGTEAQFITKEHSKQLMVSWTPGPGQYQAKSSVGNQVYSEKKSSVGFGFGTSQRFNEAVHHLRFTNSKCESFCGQEQVRVFSILVYQPS